MKFLLNKFQLHKKEVLIILLIIIVVIFLFVFYIKINSKNCKTTIRQNPPSCSFMIQKYVNGKETSIVKNSRNEFDLDMIVKERILEVEKNDMSGFNGIACNNYGVGYGFVSNQLPY